MNNYSRQPVAFSKGKGARLWDAEGREYLDAISGVAVTNLGHSNPEVAMVIAEQSATLLHTSNIYGIEWQERLAQKLCAISAMHGAFFCNSGAEANEAALKLARLHAARRKIMNPMIIVAENSFHGRTLATLAATGNPTAQHGFEPLFEGFIRVAYNDGDAARAVVESSKDVVAILVESVQGEGGVHQANPDYLRSLRTLCDRNDLLMIVDEVQTGMGRTGKWFGYQHAGIQPDVVTLAKALGNGFPIGACLACGSAAELFSPGSHASTFGGNPLACRTACTVVDIMQRDQIPDRAATLGKRLLSGLQQELKDHPSVTSIRGIGMMIGIELSRPPSNLVTLTLSRERLLINITRGNTVRLLPALTCSEEEIDEIVRRLGRMLRSLVPHTMITHEP